MNTETGEHVELTPLIPFDPRMDMLPKGSCDMSRRDVQVWIDRADPQILISLELVDAIVRGEARPEASIRLRDDADKQTGTGIWLGAVIRFEGVNRTVVYRLTRYADCCLAYVGEWPD